MSPAVPFGPVYCRRPHFRVVAEKVVRVRNTARTARSFNERNDYRENDRDDSEHAAESDCSSREECLFRVVGLVEDRGLLSAERGYAALFRILKKGDDDESHANQYVKNA